MYPFWLIFFFEGLNLTSNISIKSTTNEIPSHLGCHVRKWLAQTRQIQGSLMVIHVGGNQIKTYIQSYGNFQDFFTRNNALFGLVISWPLEICQIVKAKLLTSCVFGWKHNSKLPVWFENAITSRLSSSLIPGVFESPYKYTIYQYTNPFLWQTCS